MIVDQPYESRDPANGDVDVDPAVIETVQRLCYEIPNIKKIYKTCVVPPKKKGDQSGFSFTAKVLLNQEEPQQHLADMLEVYGEPVLVADVRFSEDMAPLPDGTLCLLLHCSLFGSILIVLLLI